VESAQRGNETALARTRYLFPCYGVIPSAPAVSTLREDAPPLPRPKYDEAEQLELKNAVEELDNPKGQDETKPVNASRPQVSRLIAYSFSLMIFVQDIGQNV